LGRQVLWRKRYVSFGSDSESDGDDDDEDSEDSRQIRERPSTSSPPPTKTRRNGTTQPSEDFQENTTTELPDFELGRDREEAPPVWQFQHGGDLVPPGEVLKLQPMLELHSWYRLSQCMQLGVRYTENDLHTGKETILWIQLKELYQLYQKLALDIHIMSSWTM
jgi:hypothetical protein